MFAKGSRTVQDVQVALAASPNDKMKRVYSPYTHCRLDPFTGDGTGHIPDGSNNNFITTDIRTFDTISMNGTAGDFAIQTFPTMPASAGLITNSATLQVNGDNTGARTAVLNSQSNMYTLSLLPPYRTSATNLLGNPLIPGANNNNKDPFTAVKARLVAAGYKLTYTGPAYDCSGYVTVTPQPLSITETIAAYTGTGTANTFIVKQYDSASPSTNLTVETGTPVLNCNVNSYPMYSLTRDSITLRPEQGIYFIPKHRSKDFKVKPIADTVNAMIFNADTAASTTQTFTSSFSAVGSSATSTIVYGGGVIWYDDDWSTATITVQGAGQDATYRWETIWCMEFNPQSNTPFAAIAKHASANKPAELDMAVQLANAAPLARPNVVVSDPRR